MNFLLELCRTVIVVTSYELTKSIIRNCTHTRMKKADSRYSSNVSFVNDAKIEQKFKEDGYEKLRWYE